MGLFDHRVPKPRSAVDVASANARADARRALSESLPRAPWPPKIGDRVHHNSGHPSTSYTAEVRGEVVDGYAVIVWRTCPAHGKSRYALMDRVEWSVFKPRRGPLPRALCRRNEETGQ